ncbi:hypothetical protein [Sorangium sp. So ce1097]|uniref:hypothetical protein n=1 Tax=Sorangium sp. So ce1097 TaxID=3133330 RepID=UPI003F60F53A
MHNRIALAMVALVGLPARGTSGDTSDGTTNRSAVDVLLHRIGLHGHRRCHAKLVPSTLADELRNDGFVRIEPIGGTPISPMEPASMHFRRCMVRSA